MRPAPQPSDFKSEPKTITIVYCADGAQRHDPFRTRRDAVTWVRDHDCVCERSTKVRRDTECHHTHEIRTF